MGSILVSTMLFNSYFPVVVLAINYLKSAAMRFYDRKYSLNGITRKTAIYPYVDLYAGPAFLLAHKYAAMLNICFITLIFGFGMPILFPIAALSLLIHYCMEKILVFYYYREPPMYDH